MSDKIYFIMNLSDKIFTDFKIRNSYKLGLWELIDNDTAKIKQKI